MSIELRHLKWAVEASHHRSLRKAAQSLNVRQSTLSRALRDLEACLGGLLFERSNGGIRSTNAGEDFLRATTRLFKDLDDVVDGFRRSAHGEIGTVVIGAQASISAGDLRATIVEFQSRYPDVQIRIIDGPRESMVAAVESGRSDIAFIVENGDRWAGRSIRVWSERVAVALPEAHPLCASEELRWDQLRNETILFSARGPSPELAQVLTSKLAGLGSLNIQCHDASLDRLLALVASGMGVLPLLESAMGIGGSYVAFRPVYTDSGPAVLSFMAIWRADGLNPALSRLLEIVRERYPNLSEPSGLP
jgi:DNA-binding transcriptional LysR family regulator